ncbi:M48 family metallopeptidase [Geotoga petraea]|uniref:STE24 endopeptidase n=1 Tax=Geotoga petraea TaxID=28234 RepID=A0A1G6PVL5_9BACT|nr:M48 family metallopeptidase [Geotoga petraea]SDC84088.1 STE24 endopeptidase [Geotoga petraea]
MFLYIFLGIYLFSEFFDIFLSRLNLNYSTSPLREIPDEMKGEITWDEFERSKEYTADKNLISFASHILTVIANILFILFIFPYVENFAVNLTDNIIYQSFLFFGFFGVVNYIISLPFNYINTFKIEQKFGFNKSTMKTFIIDNIKSIVLSVVLGAGMIYLIMEGILTFENWWIIVSLIIIGVQFIASWLYPKFIMPLFNKFTPLENENLKNKLVNIAKDAGFDVSKIYVMDASKRTGHSNAFFSGFGKTKKIVLFDTLLENHDEDEIEAIFAHEAGHYKLNHIIKDLFFSIFLMVSIVLIVFFLTESNFLTETFGVEMIYTKLTYSFIFVGSIFNFVGYILSAMSRKHEFEADNYSKKYKDPQHLIRALKKLSKSNLSNLNPHPLYAKLNYSHPTLIERIRNLKR